MGAQAQLTLSLKQAQDLGADRAYAMQRTHEDVAKRDVKELLATGLPQVRASFDFNHFLDIPTQVVPARSFDPDAPEDVVLELAFDDPRDRGLERHPVVSVALPRRDEGGPSVCRREGLGGGCDGGGDASLGVRSLRHGAGGDSERENLDRALALVQRSESEVKELALRGSWNPWMPTSCS